MKTNLLFNRQFLRAKLITAVLITASVAAFATLGDGKNDRGRKTTQRSLLSSKVYPYSFKTFSLRSGYQYRGSNILSRTSPSNFIFLNTVVTYEKGNTTYILPMKKKVLLDKIKFNPAP